MHKIIILLITCLLIFSCASKPTKKSENPGDIYVDGVNYMKMKKYDKAIEDFTYIRENFPFDPIAFIAAVKLGDVYFAKKEYLLASGVYEDFFSAHPEDENIPYVLSKLAECYEKLSLSFDQDQAYTLKAIERYVYLKNRFPASSYAKDIDLKLKVLSQKLADRELYIGEFYYKTSQYTASIIRLEYFLKKFSYAKGVDKALYYLSMSYRALGNFQKGDFYSDIIKRDFPKSLYVKASSRERKSLQLAKADKSITFSEETEKKTIELLPQKTEVKEKEKEDKMSFFDEKKPIDIVSDTMEGFDKEKYVIFKGSVVAKQEDLFIFSDTMEAYMNEKGNEIDKAYAKGSVRIVKKERTATCNEAEFDNTRGEIKLKGNVIVYSGQDKLTGEIVTYYVEEDRVVVEGEKEKENKAHITVTPQ